jgi:hypothetical protein
MLKPFRYPNKVSDKLLEHRSKGLLLRINIFLVTASNARMHLDSGGEVASPNCALKLNLFVMF